MPVYCCCNGLVCFTEKVNVSLLLLLMSLGMWHSTNFEKICAKAMPNYKMPEIFSGVFTCILPSLNIVDVVVATGASVQTCVHKMIGEFFLSPVSTATSGIKFPAEVMTTKYTKSSTALNIIATCVCTMADKKYTHAHNTHHSHRERISRESCMINIKWWEYQRLYYK